MKMTKKKFKDTKYLGPMKKGMYFGVNAGGQLTGEKASHVQNSISILSNKYEHANLQAVI